MLRPREAERISMSTSKQLLCAVTVAVCGFSGAALAQQQIIVQPSPMVVAPAPMVVAPAPTVYAPAQVVVQPQQPVVVYQPGSVIVKEVPATTRRDGSSLAEDKGP
jgi:hypothetical protein